MAAEAPDGALDELIAAVVQVKITEPAATSKQVHEILARDSAWADVGFSLVKKACSKAAKMGAITSPGQAQGQAAGAAPAAPAARHMISTFPLGDIRAGSILLSGRGPPIASPTAAKKQCLSLWY